MQVVHISENYAVEESTFPVTAAFYDEEDNAVAPDTLSWSLTDIDGNVINDREDVEIESPSSSETVILKGDDLAIQSGETGDAVWRILTFSGTYASDLGSNLPINDSLKFPIKNLIAI